MEYTVTLFPECFPGFHKTDLDPATFSGIYELTNEQRDDYEQSICRLFIDYLEKNTSFYISNWQLNKPLEYTSWTNDELILDIYVSQEEILEELISQHNPCEILSNIDFKSYHPNDYHEAILVELLYFDREEIYDDIESIKSKFRTKQSE